MDVDELEKIANLRSEDLKKYPPYLMSQLRWALHCYRWKENLSWNEYPDRICKTLGFKLKKYTEEEQRQEARERAIPSFDKEITQIIEGVNKAGPINAKDPKIWIVGGKEPTKPDKIQAYIDFLKEKAPEYIAAFKDEDFSNKVCDFLYRYYAYDPLDEKELEELSYQARYLEQYVFITKWEKNGQMPKEEFIKEFQELSR